MNTFYPNFTQLGMNILRRSRGGEVNDRNLYFSWRFFTTQFIFMIKGYLKSFISDVDFEVGILEEDFRQLGKDIPLGKEVDGH